MKYNKLYICNRALRLIRQTPITSLEDISREAEECRFLYPIIKNEVIELYPWRVARKKVVLKSIYINKNIEDSNYKYKFILPSDCIKVLKVNNTSNFKRNGIYLYYNNNKINLVYTASISEEFMSITLAKLIAIKLAIELSHSLLGDTNLFSILNNLFTKELARATNSESTEGVTESTIITNTYFQNSSNSWLNSRY